MRGSAISIVFLAILVAACATTERARVVPEPAAAPKTVTTPDPTAGDSAAETSDAESPAVAAAIERALAEGWKDLYILVECRGDAGTESVEVYGSGAAIWDKKAQFTLTRDQVRRQLEVFRDHGFARLKERYGGREATGMKPPEAIPPPKADVEGSGMRAASRITCRVTLELDGVSKRVAQLHRGEQSEALRRVAEFVLDSSREAARSGKTAADLVDGLEKAAAGELAPETLEIMLHRKPQPGEDFEGSLLRIVGRTVSSRTYRPGEGYSDPLELNLRQDGLAALSRSIAEQAPGELPLNLYAEHYTDLTIRVLDQRATIQARKFAGLTAERHGDKQERFDRIVGELDELHRRVLAEGRPGSPR